MFKRAIKNSDLSILDTEIAEVEKVIVSYQIECNSIEQRIAELTKKLSFASKKEVDEEIDTLVKNKLSLETLLQKAIDDYQKCDKDVSSLKVVIEETRKTLNNKIECDVAIENERLVDMEKQKQVEFSLILCLLTKDLAILTKSNCNK